VKTALEEYLDGTIGDVYFNKNIEQVSIICGYDTRKTSLGYDIVFYYKKGLEGQDIRDFKDVWGGFCEINTIHKLANMKMSKFGLYVNKITDLVLLEHDHKFMDDGLIELAPSCSHPKKYVNRATLKAFWVCPDCKADLGDA
jgi:hypothetical protein